ncbi:hypothetical protein MHYP_G00053510 [Metynnis hypsauchen]
MPPGRLPREVSQASPSGRRPRGRPRTRWRDYIAQLAWERLGLPPEELVEVAGERKRLYLATFLRDRKDNRVHSQPISFHICLDRPAKSSPPGPWLMGVLRSNRQELRKAERRGKLETSASDPRKLFRIFSSLLNPHPPPPPPSSLTPEDLVTFFEEKMLSFS